MSERDKREQADEKEARFREKVERLEQNEKKKKRIVAVVVVFLIAIFSAGMAWGIQSVLLAAGTDVPPDASGAVSANTLVSRGSSDEELVYCFTGDKNLIPTESALAGKASLLDILRESTHQVRLTVRSGIDVTDFTVKKAPEGVSPESLASLFAYAKGDLLHAVYALYDRRDGLQDGDADYACSYGEDFTEMLPEAVFTSATATLSDGRYEPNEEQYVELDKRFLTFSFAPQDYFALTPQSELYRAFGLSGDARDDVFLERVKEKLSAVCTVDALSVLCDGFRIETCSDRLTDRLSYIHYIRRYTVDATVSFQGEYADLGTQDISFVYTDTVRYNFTWVGLSLSHTSIGIKPGDSDDIQATAEPSDAEVHWEIRAGDPQALLLQDGSSMFFQKQQADVITGHTCYFKGRISSTEPVTLVAYFDYLGERYEQSCEVFVRKPADGIKIAEQEDGVHLSQGETTQLQATVTPVHDFLIFGDGATEKGVLWYTQDAEIALVSDTGLVTAVGAGETVVYALSRDGYYRASVPVLVKSGDISLSAYRHTMQPEETFTLTCTLADDSVNGCWESGDASILRVSDGVVTALRAGEARVYYSIFDADGAVTERASCAVTVTGRSVSLDVGETLSAADCPQYEGLEPTGWFTTDKDVVQVDENGLLTANRPGMAYVYVGFADGSFLPYAAVTVHS